MRVRIVLSGISPTGAPWMSASVAGNAIDERVSTASVRGLSRGAPVIVTYVDIDDDLLKAPAPIEIPSTPPETT